MEFVKIGVTCGICGTRCQIKTSFSAVNHIAVTTSCPECQKHIQNMEKQVGDMEDQIFDLERQVKHVSA
jgi:hypothetical protein